MFTYVIYNGERLTLSTVAKREKINYVSLKKAYEEQGNVYEAVRLCQQRKKGKHVLVEYNGKELTISEIAKIEELSSDPLRKEFEISKNIYDAVIKCKKRRDKFRGNIEYNGEMLNITNLAKKENITLTVLSRELKRQNGDIYKTVRICKERQIQQQRRIEYKGKMMSINAICEEEGLRAGTLSKVYEELGDIYNAVNQCKKRKIGTRTLIEHNGKEKSLLRIAEEEGIPRASLDRMYKKTNNIYKAIFICKSMQNKKLRNTKIDTMYGKVSYYDLSIILGIKYNELMNLIDKGYKVDEIIEMDLKPTRTREGFKREVTKLSNGQTLREFCVENKLNYACIYRAMNVYGKSLEEAVEYYKTNGQKIPTTWIYERYGLLLRHIMLKDKIDIDRVIKYMREEILSLEEGVEKYIIRKNAKKEKLDEDWMEEIYGVLTDDNIRAEYDQYKRTFYVDDKEEENVIQSCDEVEAFKRKMVLFEIAEAIEDKTFTEEEEKEVLREYNITEKEIEVIFSELYKGFKKPGVLLGEKEPRKEISKGEQEKIQNKIEEYKEKIKEIRTGQDIEIMNLMRASVGRNVRTNEKTREELNNHIKTNNYEEQK